MPETKTIATVSEECVVVLPPMRCRYNLAIAGWDRERLVMALMECVGTDERRTIAAASSRFESLDPPTLVAATARLVDEVLDLLEHAKRAGDRRTALVALPEARDGLALLMKTAGMLAPDGAVRVNVDQRKLAFETLARLPEDYIRRIRSGDPTAIDLILAATETHDATEIGTPFRVPKSTESA